MGKAGKSSNADKNKGNKPDKSNSPHKVVSFSEIQKQDTSAKRQGHSDSNLSTSSTVSNLPYERVDDYKALLEFQAQIMDQLYQLTEDMLQELHYQADKFSLNEESAMEFLDVNMHEFIADIEESLDLVFDAEIDGKIYKTLASAFFKGDHIKMSSTICKYDEENDDWLIYTGEDDEWETAPEELVYYLRAD